MWRENELHCSCNSQLVNHRYSELKWFKWSFLNLDVPSNDPEWLVKKHNVRTCYTIKLVSSWDWISVVCKISPGDEKASGGRRNPTIERTYEKMLKRLNWSRKLAGPQSVHSVFPGESVELWFHLKMQKCGRLDV